MDWKSKRVEAVLEMALLEDHANSDTTTHLTIDPRLKATATVLAKQDCVVAGLGAIPRFLEIFARIDHTATPHFEVIQPPEIFDGVRVKRGQALAVIRHNARTLLSAERVILNLLQHMSGIATTARQFVDAVAGTKTHILDTRKTVPGLRALEKYAVLCGGGTNHRLDLSDGILIKNNHIALGGGIAAVLKRAIEGRKPGQRIEVEVRSLTELEEAIRCGAEAVLLDNMTPAEVKKCVARVLKEDRWIPTEASGGIVLGNVRAYAETGVEFISVGALTHSSTAVDLSMRIQAEGE